MYVSNSQGALTHPAQTNEAIASLQPVTSCEASPPCLHTPRPHALPQRRNCPCCSAHLCLCMCAFASEYPAVDTRSICRSSVDRLLQCTRAALLELEAVGYREHVRGCSLGFVLFLRHDGQRQTSGFVVHFMSKRVTLWACLNVLDVLMCDGLFVQDGRRKSRYSHPRKLRSAKRTG